MNISVTAEMIHAVVPHARASIVEGFVIGLPAAMERFDINTEKRVEHFLAQCAHESSDFTDLTEDLSYSAKRLCQVWPSRFKSIAAAQPYARDPQKLANKVYNGRMGNRVGSNDGWEFSGKGLLQATGRDMYETLERLTGLPLIDHPELAADPANGALIAGAIWHHKRCNAQADRNSVVGVTKKINGGTIGLGDRKRLRKAFGLEITGGGLDPMWLKRGDRGVKVKELQQELARLGYYVKPDGVFGKDTERQVIAFQAQHGLDVDGLVGQATFAAFKEAVPLQGEEKGVVETLKDSSVAKTAVGIATAGGGLASKGATESGVDQAIEQAKEFGEKAREVGEAVDPLVTLWSFVQSNLVLALGIAVVGLGAYIFIRNHNDIQIGKKRS